MRRLTLAVTLLGLVVISLGNFMIEHELVKCVGIIGRGLSVVLARLQDGPELEHPILPASSHEI